MGHLGLPPLYTDPAVHDTPQRGSKYVSYCCQICLRDETCAASFNSRTSPDTLRSCLDAILRAQPTRVHSYRIHRHHLFTMDSGDLLRLSYVAAIRVLSPSNVHV